MTKLKIYISVMVLAASTVCAMSPALANPFTDWQDYYDRCLIGHPEEYDWCWIEATKHYPAGVGG